MADANEYYWLNLGSANFVAKNTRSTYKAIIQDITVAITKTKINTQAIT